MMEQCEQMSGGPSTLLVNFIHSSLYPPLAGGRERAKSLLLTERERFGAFENAEAKTRYALMRPRAFFIQCFFLGISRLALYTIWCNRCGMHTIPLTYLTNGFSGLPGCVVHSLQGTHFKTYKCRGRKCATTCYTCY